MFVRSVKQKVYLKNKRTEEHSKLSAVSLVVFKHASISFLSCFDQIFRKKVQFNVLASCLKVLITLSSVFFIPVQASYNKRNFNIFSVIIRSTSCLLYSLLTLSSYLNWRCFGHFYRWEKKYNQQTKLIKKTRRET